MYIFLFLLQLFLPIIQISEIRITTSLVLLIVLLIKGKIYIEKRYIKVTFVTTICFFLLTTIMININSDSVTIKEFLYSLIPVYIVLNYIIVYNIIDKTELNKISKCAKIFLIIELIICIIQITGILQLNEKLKDIYFFWQKINAQKNNNYLEITYRPFGTTGSPIYLSVIAYILGKTVENIDNKKIFYYISFIIIMLTGSRMGIIAFLLIEGFKLIYKGIKINPIKTLTGISLMVILIIIVYNVAPFTQKYINMFLYDKGKLTEDYSVTYRLEMLDEFLSNKGFILFGGKSLSALPEYVDSEYILRILQFGIIGCVLSIYPYIYLLKKVRGRDKYEIIIYIMIMMLTSVIITNIYYMPFIMIWIVSALKKQSMEEKNEENCIHNN